MTADLDRVTPVWGRIYPARPFQPAHVSGNWAGRSNLADPVPLDTARKFAVSRFITETETGEVRWAGRRVPSDFVWRSDSPR